MSSSSTIRRVPAAVNSLVSQALRLMTAFVVLALAAAVLTPSPAGAQVDDASDVAFEERDGIPASMIEFDGVANSANARWVVDLYEQVFSRPADLDGLDHWLARVAAGGETARLSVARSFLNSTEGAQNEANLAYTELLGRGPDPEGLAFWTDFLRTGSVNTLRFQHLASDEYYDNSGGDNLSYVEQLYFDLLGREIDPEGSAFYVGLLDTDTPRWWVSRNIYQSPESLGNRVTAYHQEILDRDPTDAELAAGVALILSEDERSVQAALLASDEAFDVFLLAALDS